MRLLVTGSRGLLGRHLLPALRRLEPEALYGVSLEPPSEAHELQADLTDRSSVADILSRTRPTAVFHLAGSFANAFETDWRNNVLAAENLFRELETQAPQARVVTIGSAAEYGAVPPSANPVREDQPAAPVSVYGLTKLCQTQLSQFHARTAGLQVVVARLFNLLGPGASDQLFVGRVERQIAACKAGTARHIDVGNLDSLRDYLSARQAAEALIALLLHGKAGDIYNVGSGRPVRMRDLLGRLLAEAGLDESIVRTSPAHHAPRHDVPVIYADITKLQTLIPGFPT